MDGEDLIDLFTVLPNPWEIPGNNWRKVVPALTDNHKSPLSIRAGASGDHKNDDLSARILLNQFENSKEEEAFWESFEDELRLGDESMQQDEPQNGPHEVAQGLPQNVPKEVPQELPQNMSQKVPQYVSHYVRKYVPRHQKQNVPQEVAQHTPQDLPQNVSQEMPQEVPLCLSQSVPQEAPQYLPPEVPKHGPQSLSQNVPEEVPQEVPQDGPQDGPQDCLAGSECNDDWLLELAAVTSACSSESAVSGLCSPTSTIVPVGTTGSIVTVESEYSYKGDVQRVVDECESISLGESALSGRVTSEFADASHLKGCHFYKNNIKKYVTVQITKTESPYRFFVRECATAAEYDAMNEQLQTVGDELTAQHNKLELNTCIRGYPCVVRSPSSNRWCRGALWAPTGQELQTNAFVEVFLVDFGDLFVAPMNQILPMPKNFANLRYAALQCQINWASTVSVDRELSHKFQTMFAEGLHVKMRIEKRARFTDNLFQLKFCVVSVIHPSVPKRFMDLGTLLKYQ